MYIHDTHASVYIPCTTMHYTATGTWTNEAGQTAGTICKHRAAGAGTCIVTIPIMVPQAPGSKGSLLKTVEVNYEITDAAVTSITASMKKVARGIEGAVAVPATVTVTQDLTAATDAADVDQHKLTVTVTTPTWIAPTEYILLVLTCVCPITAELDIHNAVAHITYRVDSVKDTSMAVYTPPTLFHIVTGTWTWIAGAVAGTIVARRAAANETSTINIPILAPSNSVALQGAKLTSIEIDYENLGGVMTSVTFLVYKCTRSADGTPPVAALVTCTQSPADTETLKVDQHKVVLTITTPFWLLDTEYVLVEMTIVAGAGGGTNQLLAAMANYTFKG